VNARSSMTLMRALLLAALLCPISARAAQFRLLKDYPVNPSPTSIVTGDFDRDGISDLVVDGCGDKDCATTGVVIVLFGRGDGTFRHGGQFVAGPEGTVVDQITSGDLNGDRVLDVVAVNNAINIFGTVSVLLGDGSGGFGAPVSYPVGGAVPIWPAIADFDGDGNPDMAVSLAGSADEVGNSRRRRSLRWNRGSAVRRCCGPVVGPRRHITASPSDGGDFTVMRAVSISPSSPSTGERSRTRTV